MKKKLVAMLAALTVLACGTTVLAAPSVSAPDVLLDKVTSVTASNGVVVTLNEVGTAVVEKAEEAAEKVTKDSEVLALVDVNVPAGTKFPITLTFEVEGVKAGDNIYILHFENGKWETIKPSKVEDGKVTATFKSLSPVAIVEAPAVAEDDKNDGTTFPGTGASVVLPMAALVCAAGAAGCAKKVKFD